MAVERFFLCRRKIQHLEFNILNTLFTDNKNPDMYAKINHRKMKSGELKKIR